MLVQLLIVRELLRLSARYRLCPCPRMLHHTPIPYVVVFSLAREMLAPTCSIMQQLSTQQQLRM